MPNTLMAELQAPRTDSWYQRHGATETVVALDGITADMDPLDADTAYISTGEAETIRAFIDYDGAITAGTLTIYVLQDGIWSWGGESTLVPERGSELRDFSLAGKFTRVAFRLTGLEGDGSVTVRALGVW